jgi:ABC-2 type transport system ATP-binding protein
MLKVQHVYKYFDSVCVNDNISLDLKSGEIFGLLGPNGAGKTTLMRMLATVTTPDRGKILIQNESLSPNHIPVIGYMPEERGLYRKMTVVDQLLYFAELKGLHRSSAKEEVKKWMKRLNIIDWADKKMEELSKGMAQKIQFISTILHRPQFLILDEPFSGFDPVNTDLIKDLILELKNEGTTILFSTHRMDNVEELCDRLAIIHEGKKILDGKIYDVRRDFFDNEFDVVFSENIAFPDSYQISMNYENHGKWTTRVQLGEEQSYKELMDFSYSTGKLLGIGEYLPTMHEVFVSQVSPSKPSKS